MLFVLKLSISPTIYEQIFVQKFVYTAFIKLQFGLVMFMRKIINEKSVYKMLIKLTP